MFGGARIDAAGNLVVGLTQLDPKVENAIQVASGSTPVTFAQVSATEQQQDAFTGAILDGVADLKTHGITPSSWGPDPVTGGEKMQVVGLTSAGAAYLTNKFGQSLELTNVPPETAHLGGPLVNRAYDSAPFNAGDFISNRTETCTSGFSAKNGSGQQFMVTASHCFAVNDNIYNYSADLGLGGNTFIGPLYARDLRDGQLDAELVTTGASHLIALGSTDHPVAGTVGGSVEPLVGSHVCSDGAFEGEHCNLTVNSYNNCQNGFPRDGNGYACRLVFVTSTDNQAAGNGDSGGPVIQFSGSTPYIAGTISSAANGDAGVVCTNWGDTTRRCYHNFFYTDIRYELALWGLQVY